MDTGENLIESVIYHRKKGREKKRRRMGGGGLKEGKIIRSPSLPLLPFWISHLEIQIEPMRKRRMNRILERSEMKRRRKS